MIKKTFLALINFLSLVIIAAAIAVLCMVVLSGEYVAENFLALGIEYVIDGIGFLVAVFSAGRTARLMASVRQGDASEKSRKPD